MKIRAALTSDHEEKRQNGRRMKDEGEPMFTLTAQDRHGVAILCKEHNEYGKSIRKDYEAGKVAESRHNMTQYACRKDGVTNILSTVQKDNLLMCKYSPTLNDDSNELAINVIGNYSPSNHNASRVVTTDGIAPTVMENHGTVTAVVVNEPKVIDALYKSREPRESDTCPTLRSERTDLLVKESLPMDYDEQDNTLCTDGTDEALKVIDAYNKREVDNKAVGTLTAHGNTFSTSAGTFFVDNSPYYRIRRLTPKECWRLQGWGFLKEDGSWDDTAFEKAKASGVSDSQLYKQAGNGCSANVVMAIGLTLKEIENSFS